MEADIQKGTYNGLAFSTTICMVSHDPYLTSSNTPILADKTGQLINR